MSVVSGVTIICSVGEETGDGDGPPVLFERLNDWLDACGKGRALVSVEEYFGGNKHPQCHVAGAGINFLDEDEFADAFRSLEWRNPECAVLIIQPEQGRTRIFSPSETLVTP